ncbi:MAG: hypothetical protein J0I06_21420 [Planctomycetes bacterium]|nr:hypothetical protein [Planctomycetota bacterium]
MPRAAWVAMALLASGGADLALAQPLEPLAPVGGPPLASTPVTPSRNIERPPPVLGAPVAAADVSPPARAVIPSSFVDTPRPQRAAAFGAPRAADAGTSPAPAAAPVPAAVVDAAVSRVGYKEPPTDTVNDFLAKRSDLRERDPRESRETSTGWPKVDVSRFGEGWGEKFGHVFGQRNGGWFRSDHMFDGFISPVSNPFLFEDPRSLTEARPIFIYQQIPSSQQDFRGGHVSFFGVQGRVAFTDRWSLVVNKFGGTWLSPGSASPFNDGSSFAELWLGPKWTFYRGEETGSVAAGGVQFQIPTGGHSAFQDTGTLSLAPYVSYGQNFLRDFRWGSFNVLANTGYSFSVNHDRSDYYWLSGHLDFDVANLHRIYPLMELNWVLNTTDGRSTPIGAEGRDLINFGGQAKGTGLLTAAFGGRGKITENAQLGGAFEIPIAGRKDLFRYRFTVDFILRY